MTRPHASLLELDGQTVKVRLQAARYETCSHVHVDWLRFSIAKRTAPIDLDLLFPKHLDDGREFVRSKVDGVEFLDTNVHAVRSERMKRQLSRMQLEEEFSSSMQALSLARLVVVQLGPEFYVNPEVAKGHDFYAKRWKIERLGKECGWVGYGATTDSPKATATVAHTIHCNLYGTACTFAVPGWTVKMAALIDEYQATLTRCDLALDFFDGAPFSMDDLHQDLKDGAMKVRGRDPSWNILGHWSDAGRSNSRSVYIGSKESGKQTNVYEKGHQLFGADSGNPWLRVELRYGNKKRVLPSDMLRRSAAFFAGASDWHMRVMKMAEAQVIAAPVPVEERLPIETAKAEVSRNVTWAIRTAGPTISACVKYLGLEQLLELCRADAPALPGRLQGFTARELSDAFESVGPLLLGVGISPIPVHA